MKPYLVLPYCIRFFYQLPSAGSWMFIFNKQEPTIEYLKLGHVVDYYFLHHHM